MKNITQHLFGWPSVILHAFLLPALYFSYVLLYSPGDMKLVFDTGPVTMLFNLTMVCCILFLSLAIARLVFHFLRKVMRMNYVLYACWCWGELLVFDLFSAMYLSLISGRIIRYSESLLFFFLTSIMILSLFYIILTFSFVVHGYRVQHDSDALNSGLIKFKDWRGKMKIAVLRSTLLYIEASENYVIICYSDDAEVKKYTLRTSMRRIEPLLSSNGLARCQRSFFINPEHVRFIGRDKNGRLYAELDSVNVPHIPISKNYYANLSSLL